MTGWRFSWRAVGAWLGAALITAVAFGLTLSLCNAWADVSGRDLSEFANIAMMIAFLSGIGFLVVGGILLLAVSVVARLVKAPRPWAEALVLAGACAWATTIGGVVFDLTSPEGTVGPHDHPAAFIVAYIAPAAAGVLMALLYRRFAGAPATS